MTTGATWMLCKECGNSWQGDRDSRCPACGWFEGFDGQGDPFNQNPNRMKPWGIRELLDSDLKFQWDATGLLVGGTYGQDAGEMKTLKSYFGLARIVGLAAGVPILGQWHVPKQRRVLAYVAEGGRVPWTRRFIRMCEAHGVDPGDLEEWVVPIFDAAPLDTATFRDSLRGQLSEFRPGFVHLDPLYPFQPMTVSSGQLSQVGAMLTETQMIAVEYDATLWITAHMNQTGAGFDLKRISGAGVGEWGDSWVLIKHREKADVEHGRFRLALDIGSRQWGAASWDLDWDIGRFDVDNGAHDGDIKFTVSRAGSTAGNSASDIIDEKVALARKLLVDAWKKRRGANRTEPWTKTHWIEDRAVGVAKDYRRKAWTELVDGGRIVPAGDDKWALATGDQGL